MERTITIGWKYGCPKGHTQIHKLTRGEHAGMIFCKTCCDWYERSVARK